MSNIPLRKKRGGNGTIIVYREWLEIDRRSAKIMGLLSGLHGIKRIYYKDVGSINFKKRGIAVGWIQFSILGGRDTRGLLKTTQNENTITFDWQNKEWEELYFFIQNLVDEYKRKDMRKQTIDNSTEKIRVQENPLNILKLRFVRGEITKEEYEHMKEIIS